MLSEAFGVDYYPEQWPEERWPEDARLMAEAGFNVVRLAEFAWSSMEPNEGRYDFSWLDRAIAILAARGLRIVLGTPTASPPPWLMTRHPEIFRMLESGQRETYGNRRNYCPNSPVYHDYTRRIVSAMAEHYRGSPAVIGWQIDNEFGQGDRCCCPVCTEAFHRWLAGHFGSPEEVNARWGTVVWSHAYREWCEIPAPLKTGNSPNPGLALDYYRFASDSYVKYQRLQIDILREKCPDHFITHNFMSFGFGQLDYFDLARDLDFVSWDNYPRTQWSMGADLDPTSAALGHDTIRGLKRRHFWVMEQEAGTGGWEIVGVTPRPGELRLWAYQAIAHGADGIVFFRWRTARYGTEQYWHGLLDHDGTPGRRYAEIKRMGAEVARVGDLLYGSTVRAAVAMLLSYDSRFAFQIQANNPGFSYAAHFHEVYRALARQGIMVDVVEPEGDLSGYSLVLAPALHVVTPKIAGNLAGFVAGGGTLVLTARSGVKDHSNAVVDAPLPGLLTGLAGAHVEEYDSLPPGAHRALDFESGESGATHFESALHLDASIWCDVLAPDGAQVAARYAEDYYAGKPAITLNAYGPGKVVYVGTLGSAALFDALAGWFLELAHLSPILAVPEGVEVAERWRGDRRLLFLLNHTGEERQVTLDRQYVALLDGSGAPSLSGQVTLPPRGVLVLG